MKTPLLILAIGAGLTIQTLSAEAPTGDRERPGFSEIDGDGNGSISLEEMQAFGDAARAERFAAADTDGDGVLTEEEIIAAAQNRRAARLIERLDANDDGVLQVEELRVREARGERFFERLDADEDGVISEAEFNDPPRRGGGGHGHGRPRN